MRQLYKSISKENIGKKIALYLTYVLNIVIISMFLMIITGFANITNESLSQNDYEQIISIISSMIFISVITIALFQWIIGMVFRSLYVSRQHFNTNIRLMGVDSKSLFKIYLYEYYEMQLIAIPLGILFSIATYYILALFLNLPIKNINWISIIGASIIHFLVVLFSIMLTYKQVSKKTSVDELKGYCFVDSSFKFTNSKRAKVIIGMIVLILAIALLFIKSYNQAFIISGTLLLISYILLYDLIFFIFNKIILGVARIFKSGTLVIANSILNGRYKKIKILNFMIVFSILLTVGMQSLYISVRDAAWNVTENNVNYSSVESLDTVINNDLINVDSDYYAGLKFVLEKTPSSTIRVLGIDSNFINNYEDIVLDENLSNFSYDDLVQNINDPNWNGIIFPQNYITRYNIGDKYTANINGKDITFDIVGGYYSNNLGELRCICSNTYLENALGLDGYSNCIFYKDIIPTQNLSSSSTIQTKDDLIQMSYDKSLNGTLLVELAVAIVLICSLLMLVNYIYITFDSSIFDISKMRGIGFSKPKTYRIYFYHLIFIIFEAFIFAVPFAMNFAESSAMLTLSPYYFPNGITLSLPTLAIILSLYLIVPLTSFFLVVRKTINKKYLNILRQQTKE